MKPKGTVKVKSSLSGEGVRCGDDSLYAGHVLQVLDIAVDDSGYLVINKDNSGLGDIPKNDVEWFKPANPDFIDLLSKHLKGD